MNILSKVEPWNMIAEGYAIAAGDLFRAYSQATLLHAQVGPEMYVADIACGPGTLTTLLAERGAKVAAVDFSHEMLAILEQQILDNSVSGVSLHQADGQDLPFPDDKFDISFSLFGLMFFPDRTKGYAEMLRILCPGGWGYVSSWSKLSDSPLFSVMAETIYRIDPARAAPHYDITSLENPDVMESEMIAAGFQDVTISRLEHGSPFRSAEALWNSFVAASAPITFLKSQMPEEVWRAKTEEALRYIRKQAGPFPVQLGTVAWLGSGRKPLD